MAAPGPFIDVAHAQQLIAQKAIVLDARGDRAAAPYIQGARVAEWTDIRDGWLRTGRLDGDQDRLRRYFEARGVQRGTPVIVYGAMADGWGEEGRIWWTLKYLGHPRVFIIDGGIQRWRQENGPITAQPAALLGQPTAFEVRKAARLRTDWRKLEAYRRSGASIVDVRTRAEFDGGTPYWSSRGGHIPGAQWLYWKHLIRADGQLKSVDELRKLFRKAGIDQERPVVTYCTGGVRSAFVVAALTQAGIPAINYDGSWWDWSARPLPVER